MDAQPLFLLIQKLLKGYNKRSSEHLNLYGNLNFDKEIHNNYEDINNLKGLEVD